MQLLETPSQEARELVRGGLSHNEAEVARQMQMCNACRYCEGFCAVFPAMTRRLTFTPADIHYMASLCHNCGACLHSCQYAPPHEFEINVPQAMAKVRSQTYADYAWPTALGTLYKHNGLTLSLALAFGLTLFLLLTLQINGTLWVNQKGNFYGLFPHHLLVNLFAPVFLFAILALALGVKRFWQDITPVTSGASLSQPAFLEATHNVLQLKYLEGGHGDGCNNEDDAFSLSRWRAHHLTFYGFLLCFAATSVGTLYHYAFEWSAPYDLPSVPKMMGAIGGISMLLGTVGLFRLNLQRHPLHGDIQQKSMDLGFIALLFLTSLSGLLLWWGRGTDILPALLAIHLGIVMALFATLPYNKFAHGIYRTAALLRFAVEKSRPNTIGMGGE